MKIEGEALRTALAPGLPVGTRRRMKWRWAHCIPLVAAMIAFVVMVMWWMAEMIAAAFWAWTLVW